MIVIGGEAMTSKQVIPTSICEIWVDTTLLGHVIVAGTHKIQTNLASYDPDTEYWFVKDDLTDLHGKVSAAQTLTVNLIAHSAAASAPSQAVISAAGVAEDKAKCRLMDESKLEVNDWIQGSPTITGATMHYFFEEPQDDDSKYARIALATDSGNPDLLLAIVWFAKTAVEGYLPGSSMTLSRVSAGPNGAYPGSTPFYHHRTLPL
jgi:hypothetical protein